MRMHAIHAAPQPSCALSCRSCSRACAMSVCMTHRERKRLLEPLLRRLERRNTLRDRRVGRRAVHAVRNRGGGGDRRGQQRRLRRHRQHHQAAARHGVGPAVRHPHLRTADRDGRGATEGGIEPGGIEPGGIEPGASSSEAVRSPRRRATAHCTCPHVLDQLALLVVEQPHLEAGMGWGGVGQRARSRDGAPSFGLWLRARLAAGFRLGLGRP